jgi:hypothetical protein
MQMRHRADNTNIAFLRTRTTPASQDAKAAMLAEVTIVMAETFGSNPADAPKWGVFRLGCSQLLLGGGDAGKVL